MVMSDHFFLLYLSNKLTVDLEFFASEWVLTIACWGLKSMSLVMANITARVSKDMSQPGLNQ